MGARSLSTHLWSLFVTCTRAFRILCLREPRFMTAGPNEKPGQGEMKGWRWNKTTGGRKKKASLKSSLSIDLPGWVEQTTKLTKQVSRGRSHEHWISLCGLRSSCKELWNYFLMWCRFSAHENAQAAKFLPLCPIKTGKKSLQLVLCLDFGSVGLNWGGITPTWSWTGICLIWWSYQYKCMSDGIFWVLTWLDGVGLHTDCTHI